MDTGYGAPVAHPYERWLLRRYAHRLLENDARHGRQRLRAVVARWLVDHRTLLGGPAGPAKIASDENGRLDAATTAAPAPARARLTASWKQAAPTPSTLEKRLRALSQLLALSPTDAARLGVASRTVLSRPLRDLIQRLEGSDGDDRFEDETRIGVLATLLATPQARLYARVESCSPLAMFGLLRDAGRGGIEMGGRAIGLLRSGADTPAGLRRRLLGKSETANLRWADYAHIDGRDVVAALVGKALTDGVAGVNILLYGAHGAGKTEFARVLAAHLRATANLRVLTGAEPTPTPQPFAYDSALARADVDLDALADSIRRAPSLAFSCCLHGPPGTGKRRLCTASGRGAWPRRDRKARVRPAVEMGRRDRARHSARLRGGQ
jgi:hypothetical protein